MECARFASFTGTCRWLQGSPLNSSLQPALRFSRYYFAPAASPGSSLSPPNMTARSSWRAFSFVSFRSSGSACLALYCPSNTRSLNRLGTDSEPLVRDLKSLALATSLTLSWS